MCATKNKNYNLLNELIKASCANRNKVMKFRYILMFQIHFSNYTFPCNYLVTTSYEYIDAPLRQATNFKSLRIKIEHPLCMTFSPRT
jgi:hypothetical protein